MAYFLLMLKTSPNEVTKSGEIFATGKLPKLPDFVKRVNTFIAVDDIILSFSIYEVPDERMFDGYKALSERLTGYFDVPGIEFKLYPLLEVKDALRLVGLA